MSTESFYHPRLLQTYLFEISDSARFAEYDLAHLLKHPVRGVYARTNSQLLINSRETGHRLKGAMYFYHDRNSSQFIPINHSINCIEDIKGPVFNADLEPLITSTMLKESSTFLTEEPGHPVVGLMVVEAFIKNHIDCRLKWKRYGDEVWFELTSLMQDTWRDPYIQVSQFERDTFGKHGMPVLKELSRRLTDALAPLLEEIDRIMAVDNREWAIIQVKRNMSRLRIQVYEDYRICEWMNEHDQGRNMKSLQVNEEIPDMDISQLWRR